MSKKHIHLISTSIRSTCKTYKKLYAESKTYTQKTCARENVLFVKMNYDFIHSIYLFKIPKTTYRDT